MGIFFERYSQMTSMLYLSWAEMGMIGAPSATVPDGGRESGAERERGRRGRGRERERERGEEGRERGEMWVCTQSAPSHIRACAVTYYSPQH